MEITLIPIITELSEEEREIERKNKEKSIEERVSALKCKGLFYNLTKEEIEFIEKYDTNSSNEEVNVELELNILDKNDIKKVEEIEEDEEIEEVEETKGFKEPLDNILFPIPTHKKILEDKNYPYNTNVRLIIGSNFNEFNSNEYRNYIYANTIGELMERLEVINNSGKKLMSEKTLDRHIKTMLKNDLKLVKLTNTENGLVYHLKTSIEGKYYTKVPYKQIKELLDFSNKNALKIFVLLKYMCSDNEGNLKKNFTTIDRKFLCEHIGLCGNSMKNQQIITNITKGLAKLGMIEVEQYTKVEVNEKGIKVPKTINSYRIRSYEEYLEIDNKAINNKDKVN